MKTIKNEIDNYRKITGAMLVAAGVYTRIYSRQCFKNNNFDITPEQFVIIEVLMHHDGLYQRQLSEITLKDRPNITRIINILEKGGYVERRSDKNKRKVFKIYLTQKAKDIFPLLQKVTQDYRKVMAEGIKKEELEICLKVLNQVLQNLLDKVDMSL